MIITLTPLSYKLSSVVTASDTEVDPTTGLAYVPYSRYCLGAMCEETSSQWLFFSFFFSHRQLRRCVRACECKWSLSLSSALCRDHSTVMFSVFLSLLFSAWLLHKTLSNVTYTRKIIHTLLIYNYIKGSQNCWYWSSWHETLCVNTSLVKRISGIEAGAQWQGDTPWHSHNQAAEADLLA